MAVLAETAEQKKTARLYSSDPRPDCIIRLIDIQAKLAVYKAVTTYLKAQNSTKLPGLKQLKAEREELISEKAQFYQKYRETHKAWLDLATAQQNLEALHRAEGRREMTRGGLHELDK